MKTNNRLFKSTLVTVLILVAIVYFLMAHFRIDEPLFLNHYYEASINREKNEIHANPLPLNYITNRSDNRVVVGMEFLEQPDILIFASEHHDRFDIQTQNNQMDTLGYVVGPYSVRQVNWEIADIPEETDLKEVVLSEVKVIFDDSSELVTTIGEIYLNEFTTEEQALEFMSGSSSSDGTANTRYSVSEEITISSFDSPLLVHFEDRIQVEIDNKPPVDAVGSTFQEGDYLTVSSEITASEGSLSDFELFDIQPILTLTNDKNEQIQHKIFNINHTQPYYSFINTYRYVEERVRD